ncbi:hypothetical protein CRG98_030406 [Punica granatum]|uniref:Uncharacterized protein n=1 Tax=Punica granatum TaxID=22663 RepID=A0A2I0IZM7_PUNGR|nr:hypothetical protein CRG98_030406 [Punica granatum]
MVVGLRSQILLRKEAEQTGSSRYGGRRRWNEAEISEEPSPRRGNPGSDDRFRDFMLKRSYSFGFERSIASERMLVVEPATTSLRRYR